MGLIVFGFILLSHYCLHAAGRMRITEQVIHRIIAEASFFSLVDATKGDQSHWRMKRLTAWLEDGESLALMRKSINLWHINEPVESFLGELIWLIPPEGLETYIPATKEFPNAHKDSR